jgi:6,7-dimethyl-8-ribityllumazine synthase
VATVAFSLNNIPFPLQTKNLKMGIVVAAWNNHITDVLLNGAKDTLLGFGLSADQIQSLSVPGAFELPLGAQMLFQQQCDAVICLGCVIKGDTPHFDYVCQAATDGILQVGLSQNKPCIFGVITTNNEQQALDRADGKLGNKGAEAALTACWMLAAKQNNQQ